MYRMNRNGWKKMVIKGNQSYFRREHDRMKGREEGREGKERDQTFHNLICLILL